jgi:membrane protease YdiL (CAAX protease family)
VIATLLLYLAAMTTGELLSASGRYEAGLAVHMLLLFALIFQSSATWTKNATLSRLLLSLTLGPLLRVLSLSVPLWPFTTLQWLGIMSVPLIASCLAVMRTLQLKRRDVCLALGPLRKLPWQVVIGLLGIPLGVVEYFILRPNPWLTNFSTGSILFAVVALALGTGVSEELIFRGIMLRSASDFLGRNSGLLYVTLVFTSLHIGFLSAADLAFVFLVGLLFGIAVQRTRSLAGVMVAHTLVNVVLYLVAPGHL